MQFPRPIRKGHPESPKHIGEHIKKKRLDLGLLQHEAAEEMGVCAWTIINWELGETEPAVHYIQRILRFLGYDPFPKPTCFAEEVLALRRSEGLTQRELARRLQVDEGTVRFWEQAKYRPTADLRERFEAFGERRRARRDRGKGTTHTPDV